MRDPTQTVRRLLAAERSTAWETMAHAMDRDPLYRFVLPHAAKRRRVMPLLMAAVLHQSWTDRAVYVPSAGGAARAVLAVVPPGGYPLDADRGVMGFLASGPDARPQLAWPGWRLVRHGLALTRAMARAHPGDPHLYLQLLGVAPKFRAKGLGGALLRFAIGRAARESVPIYLETSNPDNVGLYRRFGFEVVERLDVGPCPPIWTMQRQR